MSLGTKFVLLTAGTILAPLLAVLLVTGFAVLQRPPENPLRVMETVRLVETLTRMAREGADPSEIPDTVLASSPHAAVIVFDADMRLRASSLEEGSLPDFLGSEATGRRYFFHKVPVHGPDGTAYTVAVGFPGIDLSLGPQRILILLIAFASLAGFLAAASILIIRSIHRSLSRLEGATRRIAEGDLDFRLDVRGTDRIASLTRSFDAMRERVREEAAARSRFILAISHDLKTPLAGIGGYLDALRDGLATEPGQKERYVAIARRNADLLESRIGQLIDYVKRETSEWKSARESVDLASFLEEAATAFAAEGEARGFRFRRSIAVEPSIRVLMDADLAYRALENLVQNAFRYADPASEISFTAAQSQWAVAVAVRNAGPAIEAKDLPFLFEPFYRGSRTRRETGFGLGLSVVKSVTAAHGWTVSVRSDPECTEFTVSIPQPTGAPGRG